MLQLQLIPERYRELSEEECIPLIKAAKTGLGDQLVILGHHYQRDEVVQFADFTGDSFKLCKLAQQKKGARYIVFCGVHFMAESADMLSEEEQVVILPDLNAGCSMADMAQGYQVKPAWKQITEICENIVPITYMNSSAELKAVVGQNGGAVCTSSNAGVIFRWAFDRFEKVFFFPDEHLGRNTCVKMGMDPYGPDVVIWDPDEHLGGNTQQELRRARVILWKGYCQVHQRFYPQHVALMREKYPGINVLVHPECMYEVAVQSDYCGSTEYIIRKVTEAPAGTKWAIGTEIHLVNRLKSRFPDKFVTSLSPMVCLCSTMYRISPNHLLWALESLAEGKVVNQIAVPPETTKWALVALDRMLEVTELAPAA